MRDATTFYAHADVVHRPEAEWAPRRFWAAGANGVPIELVIDNGLAPKAEAIEVFVNHGRWIAQCPDCLGAQVASRNDPRFMCNNCANAALLGLWRPVAWPKDPAKIEALLEVRPHAHTRNWNPGETTRDLKADNIEHFGLGG